MSSEINICGVLVHGHPAEAQALTDRIDRLPGTEVHMTTGDGRFVVTVEGATEFEAGERMLALGKTDGVLSASLVYHHFEKPEHNQVP